jgi:hypothetical protein
MTNLKNNMDSIPSANKKITSTTGQADLYDEALQFNCTIIKSTGALSREISQLEVSLTELELINKSL